MVAAETVTQGTTLAHALMTWVPIGFAMCLVVLNDVGIRNRWLTVSTCTVIAGAVAALASGTV